MQANNPFALDRRAALARRWKQWRLAFTRSEPSAWPVAVVVSRKEGKDCYKRPYRVYGSSCDAHFSAYEKNIIHKPSCYVTSVLMKRTAEQRVVGGILITHAIDIH